MRKLRGFTLTELLVVIFVIAILIALLLPAVQAAREAARRTHCANNLKQLALAIHQYEDQAARLPPRAFREFLVPTGGIGHWGGSYSWRLLILPYLEQQAVADTLDLRKPPLHPDTLRVMSLPMPVYNCPTTPASANRNQPSRYQVEIPVTDPGNLCRWQRTADDCDR